MKSRSHYHLSLILLMLLLLSACGSTESEQEFPTPTPLPPDPVLERPTYVVKRQTIERAIEVTGRATPVDMVRLAFRREGRVEHLFFQRGDSVQEGDIVAELTQTEAIDDLEIAKVDLVQAKRDLEIATVARSKGIKERELDVERARTDLARLLPGGDADLVREAQRKLDEAKREANTGQNDRSWAKTTAEENLTKSAEALQDAQNAYSRATWNLDWVERYGTHPTERVPSPSDPETLIPRKLSDEEKEKFKEDVTTAERGLRSAELAVEEAQRALDKVRDAEVVGNQEGDQKVQDAQKALDRLLQGKGSKELEDAKRAVTQAQLALDEARQRTLNAEIRAVENAQRTLDRAQRKVDEGRIIAPQSGTVLALNLEEGAAVTAFEQVIEIADVSRVELATTLSAEQMRELTEGKAVEIRLLTRPDIALEGIIRRMPAPYGSGGSGGVQDRDQTTRFQINDLKNLTIEAGSTLAKIRIVLEEKPDALVLPPEAIRTFEGRKFVIIRHNNQEERITVRVGISTDEVVEILEGVKVGDVIVGR